MDVSLRLSWFLLFCGLLGAFHKSVHFFRITIKRIWGFSLNTNSVLQSKPGQDSTYLSGIIIVTRSQTSVAEGRKRSAKHITCGFQSVQQSMRYHSFHFAKEETELNFREVISLAQSPVSPKLQRRDFNSKWLDFTVQVPPTPQQIETVGQFYPERWSWSTEENKTKQNTTEAANITGGLMCKSNSCSFLPSFPFTSHIITVCADTACAF